jgi:hypothetical protein
VQSGVGRLSAAAAPARPLGGVEHRGGRRLWATGPNRSGARNGAGYPATVLPPPSQSRQYRRTSHSPCGHTSSSRNGRRGWAAGRIRMPGSTMVPGEASWPATAAPDAIEPRSPTPPRTGERPVPSRRSWRLRLGCARWWRTSWPCAGRRSRSRAGCRWPTPMTRACASPMRPFTSASSCSTAGRFPVRFGAACGPVERCAIRGGGGSRRAGVSSSTCSRSGSGPSRSPTGSWLATGRVTWDQGKETAEHARFTTETGVAGVLL